tara:strand:- start:235 stop:339 length:105 start_codon:yes stop_codon:yes gene_type:complete
MKEDKRKQGDKDISWYVTKGLRASWKASITKLKS